jgi:hypothetical protein
VVTEGANGIGLVAQSIGGGGGIGAFSLGIVNGTAGTIKAQVGGSEGVASNGDEAKIRSNGIVQTSGALAPGLLVQSIGGGGGYAGFASDSGVDATSW